MDGEEQKVVPTGLMAFLMLSRDRLYMVSDNICNITVKKENKKHGNGRRNLNSKTNLIHRASHQTGVAVASILHNEFTGGSLQLKTLLLDNQNKQFQNRDIIIITTDLNIYRWDSSLATLPGLKDDDRCLLNRPWNLIRINFGWG